LVNGFGWAGERCSPAFFFHQPPTADRQSPREHDDSSCAAGTRPASLNCLEVVDVSQMKSIHESMRDADRSRGFFIHPLFRLSLVMH